MPSTNCQWWRECHVVLLSQKLPGTWERVTKRYHMISQRRDSQSPSCLRDIIQWVSMGTVWPHREHFGNMKGLFLWLSQ